MNKSLNELQKLMIEQVKQRGFYPFSEKEIILRLGEEMGEVMEAIRKKHKKAKLALEIVDVLWILMALCDFKKIDFEKSFFQKIKYNLRKRPKIYRRE